MTSNGLAETLNHIEHNPTTYAKTKYACFSGPAKWILVPLLE